MKTYKTILGILVGLLLLTGPTLAQTATLPSAPEYSQWISQRSQLWQQELADLKATPGVSSRELADLASAMEEARTKAKSLASATPEQQEVGQAHLAASVFLVERRLEFLMSDPTGGTLAAGD